MPPDQAGPDLPVGTGDVPACGARPLHLADRDDDADRAVAVFTSAVDAAAAALDLQHTVAHTATGKASVRVRIALHTGGEAHATIGRTLQRGMRLCDIAHGGQTLLSSVTASIVADALPVEHMLRAGQIPQTMCARPDQPGSAR